MNIQKTILFQKIKTGRTQQWSIWVIEKGESGFPEVHIEHGLTDGKKQTTFDVISEGVNEGKANETTPLQQASLVMERKITKQLEHGYTENITSTTISNTNIDFSEPLLKELCFYKPKNSLEDKKLQELEKNKKAVFSVKRDGMCHIIRKTKKFGVEIYSRRMDLVTDKYPHLVEELNQVKANDFILLGEMILDKDGKDNFNGVSQICRSDADVAIARQKELGWLKYYIFDIAFLEGQNLLNSKSFRQRLKLIESEIIGNITKNKYINKVEIINKTHDEAMKEIKDRKLEGLVVWDGDGIIKPGEAYTFNGKAYRPNVIFKSKPKFEDDFIVRFDPRNGIGEMGSGKNKDKIKSAFIYQLEDGKEVLLGKCGGGLTDVEREFYTFASYPRVWRIEYDSIQPKTGSLRFPVFKLDRTNSGDKEVVECEMSEAIRLARAEEVEEDE